MAKPNDVAAQEPKVVPQPNDAVETAQPTSEVPEPTTDSEFGDIMSASFADKVKYLQKKYGRVITRTIKNFNFEVLDNYTRISFTLREPIKAYVNNVDEDKYELGKSNVIFNSAYAFAGVLKENEDLAFTANDTVVNPKLTGLLTIGGTIDIIQQEIPEGEEYINIFSSDPEPMVFDHDVIINHIVGFKPGKTGLKFVDRYMDKLMEMI